MNLVERWFAELTNRKLRRSAHRSVRAARRVLAVVGGVELEILVGVEAVGFDGRVVMTTPGLDRVEPVVLNGRPIPVLPLSTMRAVLEATGRHERAAMVRDAMGQDPPEQPGC